MKNKIVNLDALDKIAKELRKKALADISQQEEEIEKVRDMFGGKSFRYVLQEEYDNLSEEEKNDPSIVWNIIDAEEPVSKEYVDEQISNISNNGITEAELDLLLEGIFGINSKNELTSVRLGNYQMKYDNVNDTLDFIYNGVIDEPEVPPTTEEEIIPLVWAVGNLSGTDGSEKDQENSLRSSFAAIEDNYDYSFYLDTSFYDPSGVRVYFYDTNKTYISRTDGNVIGYVSGIYISIDVPTNAAYMRFKANASGTTLVDTIGSLFTLRKRKTAIVNNYVREGLSLYIDADDVATYGSVRDITGKQNIVNHEVSTTLDNGCLNFVASESDYIDCGFVPNLTQWSAEIYFYFTNSETGTLLSWGVKGNRTSIAIWSNDFMIAIRDDVQHTIMPTAPTSLAHLVLTYNNGRIIAYVNGVKSQITASANVMSSQAGNLMIGTKYSASDDFGNIHLKSLRFYDGKVLTDEEALQNYNYEIKANSNTISVTWNDGKSLTGDGGVVPNETAMITDHIKIDNNYIYTIRYNPTTTNEIRIAFYDSSLIFIARSDYLTSGNVDTVITFPENTAYFRIKSEKVGITVNEANDNIIIKKVAK